MTSDAVPTGFIYVTRLPPSPSGVAWYAQDFSRVLASIAPTQLIPMPPRPEQSQRVRQLARLVVRLLRAARRRPDAVVHIELAGRGIAEFWAALALVLLRPRARMWLTVHDTPELSGGAFFVSALDRKGFRRIAAAASATIGRRAERTLLGRSERVYCLSETGARELRGRFGAGLPVRVISHVVAPGPAASDAPGARAVVFLPGYLDGIENVEPALDAIATAPPEWTLAVGPCSADTAARVSAAAAERGIPRRVQLLGLLPESALLDVFRGASVVVRWRREGWPSQGTAQHGAVSGPLMRAMANGCAIVTNDTRGTVDCLADAGAIRLGSGASGAVELRDALRALIADPGERHRLGNAARRHAEHDHGMGVVAAQLEAS